MKKVAVALAAMAMLIFAVAAVESQTRILHRIYAEAVLDNSYHDVPCDQLPTVAEVTQVLESHQDMVERIQRVHPGQVGFEIHPERCPGRADITIWYASHQDRLEIVAIIDGDGFFGMPYNLENR